MRRSLKMHLPPEQRRSVAVRGALAAKLKVLGIEVVSLEELLSGRLRVGDF